MTLPIETLLPLSIDLLSCAATPDDISQAATTLTAGLGLERFTIVTVHGLAVTRVFHNAPAELTEAFANLAALSDDPVVERAHITRLPFLWNTGDAGAWRLQHGDFGYQSGVAASAWEGSGSGCIIVLSYAGEHIPPERTRLLLGHCALACAAVIEPLRQIASAAQAPCPLTEREIECLCYVAAGRSAKQTSRALGISIRTVGEYLERARAKLEVKNSLAAATIAIRKGWLSVDKALDLAA